MKVVMVITELAVMAAVGITAILGLLCYKDPTLIPFNLLQITTPMVSQEPAKSYSSAGVSCDGYPCSDIAVDILRRNGTVADAAIAGLFCLGVVNPQSGGLGGGFLLTYYNRATGKSRFLNAREVAPKNAYPEMLNDVNAPNGLKVGVPGEVRGYYELYKELGGNVPWKDLIEPSIKLCEEGHPINWYVRNILLALKSKVVAEPSLRMFVNQAGTDVKEEGEIVKRPQLAKTLRILQKEPDALYTGPLALSLAKDIQAAGGIITQDDLKEYSPVWGTPITAELQSVNAKLLSAPSPGSGIIVSLILNIMDEMTNSRLSSSNKEDNTDGKTREEMDASEIYYNLVEAMKYGYGGRFRMGDDRYVDMSQLIADFSSDLFAANLASLISKSERTSVNASAYSQKQFAQPEDQGTAHMSLLAPNGDAISVTTTINYGFGAMFRSESTGLVLNNQMEDFSKTKPTKYGGFVLPPSPTNFIAKGKNPLSSTSPSIIIDNSGDVRLVIGGSGGIKIPTSISWVTTRLLWFQETLKTAMDSPRLHHQLLPMVLNFENGFSEDDLAMLTQKGHTLAPLFYSSVIGAVVKNIDTKEITPVSDYRKAGQAAGL